MGYLMRINKQTRGQGADPTFPRLLGERLCLNFVNTIESPRAHPQDYLNSYADLVRWERHASILSDAETDRLLRQGTRQPEEAASVFARALILRQTLTRIFRAIAQGDPAQQPDLNRVQTEFCIALNHARLTPTDSGYGWRWDADDDSLDRPLWDVVRSAVEVLTVDDLARVKECPGADDCGWLFYDTSKNNSRRWCSMEGCGSRVKMRRHYARRTANGAITD